MHVHVYVKFVKILHIHVLVYNSSLRSIKMKRGNDIDNYPLKSKSMNLIKTMNKSIRMSRSLIYQLAMVY